VRGFGPLLCSDAGIPEVGCGPRGRIRGKKKMVVVKHVVSDTEGGILNSAGLLKKMPPISVLKATLATFDAAAERCNSTQIFLLCA